MATLFFCSEGLWCEREERRERDKKRKEGSCFRSHFFLLGYNYSACGHCRQAECEHRE